MNDRTAVTAAALALALAANARDAGAQTATHEAKLGVFFTYGLDAEHIRLDKVERVRRIDGRPYVRTVDPGDGRVGYLILTLTLKNDRPTPAYLPALVTTIATDSGPAIAPPVFGPYVGNSTTQADPKVPIPAHTTTTLHLAVIDIPNASRITALTLSPNDATAQYNFRVARATITPLALVPRQR